MSQREESRGSPLSGAAHTPHCAVNTVPLKSAWLLSKLAVTGLPMFFPLGNLKGPQLRCAMKEGTDYCLLLAPQKTCPPSAHPCAASGAVTRLKCYHAGSRKRVRVRKPTRWWTLDLVFMHHPVHFPVFCAIAPLKCSWVCLRDGAVSLLCISWIRNKLTSLSELILQLYSI